MSGTARVIVSRKPRGLQEIKFRAGVMTNESYASLRHILRFEDDLEVVQAALKLSYVLNDSRKVRLLLRKLDNLMKKGR